MEAVEYAGSSLLRAFPKKGVSVPLAAVGVKLVAAIKMAGVVWLFTPPFP